jgi:hypothetical protein
MFVIIYCDRGIERVYGSFKSETAARKEAKSAIHRYGKLTIGKVNFIATGENQVEWKEL